MSDERQPSDVEVVRRQLRHLQRVPLSPPAASEVRRRALRMSRRRTRNRRIGGILGSAALLIVAATSIVPWAVGDNAASVQVVGAPVVTTAPDPSRSRPEVTEHDGLTASIRRGDLSSTLALLEAGVPVDPVGRFGLTPLMIASIRDDRAAVAALLAYGADPNRRSDAGQTALHYAASFGSEATVEEFVERGAPPDLTNPLRDGRTPLMDAVSRGSLEIIGVLVDGGADPSAVDTRFRSVLHHALDSDNTNEVVADLMRRDATWLNPDGERVATRGRPIADVVRELEDTD